MLLETACFLFLLYCGAGILFGPFIIFLMHYDVKDMTGHDIDGHSLGKDALACWCQRPCKIRIKKG